MTPSVRQRLGLDPVRLDARGRERLIAARAASVLYVGLATLTLIASALGTSLAARPAVILVGVALSYVIATVVFFAYERLRPLARYVLAAAGSGIVVLQIVGLPDGIGYAPLYTWLVLYVGFFYSRRQATIQILGVVATLGAALFSRYGFRDALGHWVLLAGVLGGAGVITTTLRGRLDAIAARASRDRASLKAFFDHAAGGFGFIDSEFRYGRVNAPLAAMIGFPAAELAGMRLADVSAYHGETLEPIVRSVLESGEPLVGVELPAEDGIRHFLADFYPVGGTDGIGMSVVDVTRLKDAEHSLTETNRKLAVLATTDELTGLPNRRALTEQLDLALARARRGGLAVALLSIDLDRFKEVNDTLGHAYGDRLLAEVASKLRRGARDTDVVARIGGDEFLVLLADLNVQDAPDAARTVATRIQELLELPISIPPVELRADASIGIATYPLDAGDAESLLAAADSSMYGRKNETLRVA